MHVGNLPEELQRYLSFIEEHLKTPIVLLSTGPGRDETLVISDPFSK